MKLILSRKGFDSASGGGPSPILPDGRLLSLPIPEAVEAGGIPYAQLKVGPRSLASIMSDLGIGNHPSGHLDPDIDAAFQHREQGWRPAFGQAGAAQRHLENQGIGPGDLFLFFGLFRQTVEDEGRLRWMPGSKPLHAIWGYLQIGDVVTVNEDVAKSSPWMARHPHVSNQARSHNMVYVARPQLSLHGAAAPLPGANTLRWSPLATLTAAGCAPSQWELPKSFSPEQGAMLSFHGDASRWADAGGDRVRLASVGRGQEFVTEADPSILQWAAAVIHAGGPVAEPAF